MLAQSVKSQDMLKGQILYLARCFIIFPWWVKIHYGWATFHHFSPKKMMYNKYNRCAVN
jgi:hypothetical protein